MSGVSSPPLLLSPSLSSSFQARASLSLHNVCCACRGHNLGFGSTSHPVSERLLAGGWLRPPDTRRRHSCAVDTAAINGCIKGRRAVGSWPCAVVATVGGGWGQRHVVVVSWKERERGNKRTKERERMKEVVIENERGTNKITGGERESDWCCIPSDFICVQKSKHSPNVNLS